MSWLLSDYDFDLPEELIAKYPPPNREDARMLVVERETGKISHRSFKDFPTYLNPERGDLAVLNNARVLPARLFANEGKLELLLIEDLTKDSGSRWLCWVKPGRKARVGACIQIGQAVGKVEEILEEGERIIQFDRVVNVEVEGHLPLPPYFNRDAEAIDQVRYQTVFARKDSAKAIAAPTAGLHFTPEILNTVSHTFVTLEVGIGTFRPVKTEDVRKHHMHSENYEIDASAANAINHCRERGGRLFAIGTTSIRVLETAYLQNAGKATKLEPQKSSTNLFLYPPTTIHSVDALLTNFHLPKSTLLMLVSAFASRELMFAAYAEAVREQYRFFSYGDCMLIL